MLRTHPQCWTGRFSPVRHQHSACKSRCAFLGLWAIGYRAKSAWKTTGVSLALSRRTPRPARLMCLARAGGSRREPEMGCRGALLFSWLLCNVVCAKESLSHWTWGGVQTGTRTAHLLLDLYIVGFVYDTDSMSHPKCVYSVL